MKTMALKPRMSEKTHELSKAENVFVFVVPKSANKMTVKQAVENQFGVKVADVRILVEKGKAKHSYKKRMRPVATKRADKKKAYVKLGEGDSIPIFAAVEEAEKKAQAAEAKAKAKAKAKKEKS
jgi:large subunit ribosomal protein L23